LNKIELSLGTAQFGYDYGITNSIGLPKIPAIKEIINLARELNIQHLDTAKSYGDSELNLGKVGVSDFSVTTKLGDIPQDISKIESWTRDQVEESLRTLNIDKLYGILVHNSKMFNGEGGAKLMDTLLKFRLEGLVQKIGVSIYEPDELKNIRFLSDLNIVQAPFNIFDRRIQDTGWIDWLNRKNIEIEARSIFLQGLLLLERHQIPKKFEIWAKMWDEWDSYVSKSQSTRLDICINFVVRSANFDRIVIGMETPDQLNQIVDAANNINFKFNDLSFSNKADSRLLNPFKWALL
jgi:aryl-alcohol dehydrogenase-like predicted oxidoreductase